MNRREVLRVGTLVPVAVVAGCADVAESAFRTDVDITPSAVEEEILELVNDRREEQGMAAYTRNEDAHERARAHAEDMAANDYYDHTAPDGTTQEQRYGFCQGGENIDKTFVGRALQDENGEQYTIESDEELAAEFVSNWMNSPPHRDRGLFGPWTSAGPGVAVTDDQDAYAVLGFCLD